MELKNLQNHEEQLSSPSGNLLTRSTSGVHKLLRLSVVVAALFLALFGTTAGINGTETKREGYQNVSTAGEYVGDEACRQCHSAKYESFKKTGMGRSISRAGLVGASSNPVTINEKDDRAYSVSFKDGKMLHSETQLDSAGKPIFTEAHQVAYSVGSGDHGQSYL